MQNKGSHMHVSYFAIILAILVALYGGMHYYLFRKLYLAFPDHQLLIIIALVLCFFSIFIAVYFVHRDSQAFFAGLLLSFAFTWMGLVFLFFFISVGFDALTAVCNFAGMQSLAHALAKPGRIIWVSVLVMSIGIYGYWSAQQINIDRIKLASEKLSRPVTIVQITDLHLGILSKERHIQQIVSAVNALAPDIIVSTGDLVDMQMDHMQGLLAQISNLHARWGKYAVYGNHEYIAGLETSREFITTAGFTLLSASEVTIKDVLNIAGVDDPMVIRSRGVSMSESELLSRHVNGLYTVLLKHQPVLDPESIGLFDLQLSGHVHGGQIFPFGVLTWLVYRTPLGLSSSGDGSRLFVSRGAGTWGPPMRVLAPPEITVFELRPAAAGKKSDISAL
jgi:predicted MPP superfamily phosphohydrolase